MDIHFTMMLKIIKDEKVNLKMTNDLICVFVFFFFHINRIGWLGDNMVNGRIPSVFSKTYVTPRRPYEKARLDQELKIIGEYGLRNKREVWRVKYALAKIRKAARELLTLDEKDEKRLFQGNYYTENKKFSEWKWWKLERMICIFSIISDTSCLS